MRDTGGRSGSRGVCRGAIKASFMKDRVGHELGFGEVKRTQRTEDTSTESAQA